MTTRTRAYRYELDLNDHQSTLCAQHAGLARYAWNWALAARNDRYQTQTGKDRFTTAFTQMKDWVKQKPKWAYTLSAWAAVSSIEDVDKSFKSFWKGRRVGRRVGLPRFKAKGRCRESFRSRGSIKVEPTAVQLPKLGWLRIQGSARSFHADKILYASVSREAGRWYVAVTVEQEVEIPKAPLGAPIGVDLGIAHFATLSTGEQISAPKPLARALRKLARQQRAIARSQRKSASRRRKVARLARTHARIRLVRGDFLHKLSHRLATQHAAVGVENLNVAGMVRNRRLGRAISDLGWSEFIRQLTYKTQWYGSTLVAAGRFYPSTKLCSSCGAAADMPLAQRVYECAACGLVLDRDLNAALNLVPIFSPVAVTPTETQNAGGGNVSPGPAWQIPLKPEPSTPVFDRAISLGALGTRLVSSA